MKKKQAKEEEEEEKEFENLINYEFAKEWLKKQRNVNVYGCNPKNIVMELLEVAAKIADGQYRDIEEAESDLYAILS